MLVYSNIINVGLTYIKGLDIAELKEGDITKSCNHNHLYIAIPIYFYIQRNRMY